MMHQKRMQWKQNKWALLLMLLLSILLLATGCTCVPALAEVATPSEAEDIPTSIPEPTPTSIPMEAESPYKVFFSLPHDWTNAATAETQVRIVDRQSMGIQHVEAKLDGEWEDITHLFAAAEQAGYSISQNGTLRIRITDPHGHMFEEKTLVNLFDRHAPTVSTNVYDGQLQVEAQDDLSGVAGVQVNGLLFTATQQGTLSIDIRGTLQKYERLVIRAFDFAGNFTEPMTMDNPYYEPAPTPTPTPTAISTTKPPQTSSGSGGKRQEMPGNIATAPPATVSTPTFLPSLTPAVTPEVVVKTEYIPLGPGMPYLSEGNSHTLDMLYSAATNKQFLSIQTRSGNTFYLVIDYDKPIDEEAEMYETYFLNLVDERDLLSLLDEDDLPTPTPTVQPTSVPTPTPRPTSEPISLAEEKPDNAAAILMLLMILLLAGGGAAILMLKRKKPSRPSMEFDLEDEEDEEAPNE